MSTQTLDLEGVEVHIPAPTATATDTSRALKAGIQEKLDKGIHTLIQMRVLVHLGPPRIAILSTD